MIVSNDAANRNPARVVVVPLTSNTTHLYPGEAIVSVAGARSKAMVDQIMAADKRRLTNRSACSPVRISEVGDRLFRSNVIGCLGGT